MFLVTNAGVRGMTFVAFTAMAMDLCIPEVAGTQFAAYMAVANLSMVAGPALAGPVEANLPMEGVLLVAASSALLAALSDARRA